MRGSIKSTDSALQTAWTSEPQPRGNINSLYYEISLLQSSPLLTLLMLIQGYSVVNYIYGTAFTVLSIHKQSRGAEGITSHLSVAHKRKKKSKELIKQFRYFLDSELKCWNLVSLPPSLKYVWVDRRCRLTLRRREVVTSSGCLCNTAGRDPNLPSQRWKTCTAEEIKQLDTK